MQPDAPLLFEDMITRGVEPPPVKPSNISKRIEFSIGDLAAGFAAADEIVEMSFKTAPVHQGYIEPHACLARFEADGQSVLILHREVARNEDIGVHEASGGWLGLIVMTDTIRDEAAGTIAELRGLGIKRTVMLTGDNVHVAESVARQVGIDEYHASLLPEEKVRLLDDIQRRYGATMMIGDGVNDAPALAHASVGLAMGAAGSDLALETAHCVLMSDDLRKVAYALALSRRARRTVAVNLAFSAAVILLLLSGVFFVDLPLTLGIAGHEGSTVIVCVNGLRLLRSRR